MLASQTIQIFSFKSQLFRSINDKPWWSFTVITKRRVWTHFEELIRPTKLLLTTFYDFLTRHLKNVKSHVFGNPKKNVKYVFSNTVENYIRCYSCKMMIEAHDGGLQSLVCRLEDVAYELQSNTNTVRYKKGTSFLLCASFLIFDRNWWIFFTYIRPKESRSISYNSVYLILACVENFAATVTLNVLC